MKNIKVTPKPFPRHTADYSMDDNSRSQVVEGFDESREEEKSYKSGRDVKSLGKAITFNL